MNRQVAILLALFTTAFLALPVLADDPGYTTTTAMVPVGDGTVHLDTKVYVPTGAAPVGGWPVLVRHHGGGSHKDNEYDTKYGLQAVDRGFAVVMYSVRGHGASEGSFDFFGSESVEDFSDVLDWVDVNLPSVDSNNVGATGISQGGGMSLLPAAFDQRIKAVAVGNTFDSLNHALNPNDCFKFSFATGIFAAAYKAAGARTKDEYAVRWGATWYTDTEDESIPPWIDGSPVPPPTLPYLYPSTTAEAAGRSPVTYKQNLIDRRIPVFWSNSWEDQLFPGDHPEKILQPLEDEGIPVHYWFASGGHAAGPNDPTDEAAKETAQIDWFDEFLRGNSHGFATGPKVDYAQRVPGGSTWTHKRAPSWPVPSDPTSLYANLDGWLGSEGDDPAVGVIVNDYANANIANDAIVSMEVPGRFPDPRMGQTIKMLPERGTGADTASFATSPLGEDVEMTGAPVVSVDLDTTAKTVIQLNAKVWDVAPDGSATMINRGCISGAPDSEISFSLWPNSHVFTAGHSIRLDIAAVDFPTFEADKEPATTVLGPRTRVSLPIVSGSL